jgi:fumarate hydratase class I
MGKGGMGGKTLKALFEHGCVYLHTIGGASQYLAERIIRVETVYLIEFGQPEAMWVLKIKDFPALVTMDSHGNSLHSSILDDSTKRLETLFEQPFKKNSHT